MDSNLQHLVLLDTKLLPWVLSSGIEVVIEQCEENIHDAKKCNHKEAELVGADTVELLFSTFLHVLDQLLWLHNLCCDTATIQAQVQYTQQGLKQD